MKAWSLASIAVLIALASCNSGGNATPPPPAGPPPPVTPPGPTPGQQSFKWSDPNAWGGAVPAAGATVTIPANKYIVLDVSPPALKGLQIDGALVFDDKDLELTSNWVMVHGAGRLEVGRTDKPFTKRATITLTGTDTGENVMGMGTKLLGAMGGSIELVGEPNRTPWTKLSATVTKGAKTITVADAGGWRVGDRIVLASTDYDPLQAEDVTITAVTGNTITFDKALAYMHFGEVTNGIDERGEVGLLTRNVVVRGDDGSTNGFGGHMMIMVGSSARVVGVQFQRMGQKGKLGRYPVHFHLAGDESVSFVKDSSIFETYNRCLTIHATQNLLVSRNVAYNNIGHCYFLEDGLETGNKLESNLAILAKPSKKGEEVIPSDNQPSSYWITNPANSFIGNVAAGSQHTGFWFAMPEHPTGASKNATNDANVWPRRTALGEFRDNVSHSNDGRGLNVDNMPRPDGTLEDVGYTAYTDKANRKGVLTSEFKTFTSYKNRERAVWFRGSNLVLSGAKLADNAIGATFASDDTMIKDSLVVGETANKGTPKDYEVSQGRVGVDGRSMPRPWEPTFPIRGYEFYDGLVSAVNTKFVNFLPDAKRQASALSYLRFTSFSIDSRNHAQGLQFENANHVYFEPRPDPVAADIAANDDRGEDGYRTAVFNDADGSVTGVSGATVVINNPFLTDGSCTAKPEWNAQVCTGRFARVYLENASKNGVNIAPVTITRDDGRSNPMWGPPNGGAAATTFQSSVLLGRTYSYALSGAKPAYLRIHLHDAKPGDSVRLSIPWSGAVYAYQNYYVADQNKMLSVANLTDLDASTKNAYFLDGGTLNMKLIATGTNDYTTAELCVTNLCK
jgi:cell migration-inducing and hyaluronan-binding protein